ncbi:MAG TPA: DUF1295 domain-containing protein [Thermoleophilaceae bacterium]
MKRAQNLIPTYVPCVGFFLIVLLNPPFQDFAVTNLIVQAVLFVLLASIPAYMTGKMSWVDLAWPAGLAAIGIEAMVLGDGLTARKVLVGGVYLIIGLRMAMWSLSVVIRERGKQAELPRYQFQRRLWKEAGFKGETAPMQWNIFAQMFLNAGLLALPAVLLAYNPDSPLHPLEVFGFALWAFSWIMESTADLQKARFVRRNPDGTCNVGLWRYSRHPNYFFQWMNWNSLVIAALPSLFDMADDGRPVLWALTALGVVAISGFMYGVLTEFTGAKPAESYSVDKRPGYAEYQRTTNMFFLGPKKKEAPAPSVGKAGAEPG